MGIRPGCVPAAGVLDYFQAGVKRTPPALRLLTTSEEAMDRCRISSFSAPRTTYLAVAQRTRRAIELKKLGGTYALIHYGGGSAVRSGLIDRVKRSTGRGGREVPKCWAARGPTRARRWCTRALSCAARRAYDCLLAVGGGSAIELLQGQCDRTAIRRRLLGRVRRARPKCRVRCRSAWC